MENSSKYDSLVVPYQVRREWPFGCLREGYVGSFVKTIVQTCIENKNPADQSFDLKPLYFDEN